MFEKDICPICGKEELEKLEIESDWKQFVPAGREVWGCSCCGNSFFKKIKIGD